MIVDPEYKPDASSRLLVQWGAERALELKVDSIIISTPDEVPLYESYGYGKLGDIQTDFNVSDPSEKWKEYQSQDLRMFVMYKPSKRPFKVGDKGPTDAESSKSHFPKHCITM